ncbi:class I SAM-dependent methyltransferase [Aphanothece hegewaldii CCALA 016]|uniref:Class I SAM-dependent methyltransferase n=1 Tax=Aphanothece hegewaldii CCALA 016 TaxID=2107694 RepID=A0A2T1M338_9CHRO|nr:class I SAM-dependent methyltransferase [Aphanothece hegewaldii]PSF39226.1 class I SAM-dependent methyltransferase [Aphanothece hegewaldii CCALA 016]
MNTQLTLNDPLVNRNWADYYDAVRGHPPRNTLITALNLFDAQENFGNKLAVDLGCGDGRDTIELIRRNWNVLAIDGERTAITRLKNRSDLDHTLLQTQIIRFEVLKLPLETDLINASFSLPFCPSSAFFTLWEKIVKSLRSGGRFSGQFFGDRDSWAIYPSMTHLSCQQVEILLKPFEVELFQEQEQDGLTPLKENRHWHIFQIVARKR